jgi:hypothetical protein
MFGRAQGDRTLGNFNVVLLIAPNQPDDNTISAKIKSKSLVAKEPVLPVDMN